MRSRPLPIGILLFTVATMGEFAALYYWRVLMNSNLGAAVIVLWGGFVVERGTVVFWLRLPSELQDPWGKIRPRWLILFSVTCAEIVAWIFWRALSHHAGFMVGAAFFLVAIHLIHSYEVAVISPTTFEGALANLGTITLSIVEALGGTLWLWQTDRGRPGSGAMLLLASLLIEHILQVLGQTHKSDAARPSTLGSEVER